MAKRTLIVNCAGATPLDILIEDGRIVSLHESVRALEPAALKDQLESGDANIHAESRSKFPLLPSHLLESEIEIVDAAGLYVVPGFVQAHVHLCQTHLRHQAEDLALLDWLRLRIWPGEAALTKRAMYLTARLGIAELLLGGTTTILDMASMRHADAVLEAMHDAGIRGFSGNCLMDDPESCPPDLCEDGALQLHQTEELWERFHGRDEGRLGVAVTPRFAISCREETLRSAVALAEKRDMLIHTHSSESLNEMQLVRERTGRSNFRYFADIGLLSERACLAHCIHFDEGDMDLLVQSGAKVLHCPTSNLKLGSGIAPVSEFLRRGIVTAIGSDGAPCNNVLDSFSEMRLAALIHRVASGPAALPAAKVLSMMTQAGATALGLQNEIGRIAVGYRADLMFVDLSGIHNQPFMDLPTTLVFSARSSDVRHVMVNGRWLVRAGALVDGDVREWQRELDESLTDYRERFNKA